MLGALTGEPLDLVDDLLALVIPPARVALRVLVGEDAAGGFEHGHGDIVLRWDQPDRVPLPTRLSLDELRDLRVSARDVRNRRLMHGVLLTSGGRTELIMPNYSRSPDGNVPAALAVNPDRRVILRDPLEHARPAADGRPSAAAPQLATQPVTASSSFLRCWSPSPPTRRLSSIPASSIRAAALAGP